MDKLPDLTPVKSSMMAGYAYDPNTRDLVVQFNSGAAYRYSDVSAEKVEAMAGNKSIGAYFNAKISGKHPAVKL